MLIILYNNNKLIGTNVQRSEPWSSGELISFNHFQFIVSKGSKMKEASSSSYKLLLLSIAACIETTYTLDRLFKPPSLGILVN